MDPSPIRIVVQQAWKPEVIIEESEEELDAFNRDLPPTTPQPVMKSRLKVVHLEVPPKPQYGRSRTKKKKKRSVRRAGKTLQFVAKWTTNKKKRAKKLRRAALMKKITTGKALTAPFVRPSYRKEVYEGENWLLKYLPLNPTSYILYWWLLLVSSFVLYNCFLVIVRETYHQLNDAVLGFWLTLDYMSDLVYIIDMGMHFITSHVSEHGLLEVSFKRLAIYYVKSRCFWMDVIAILPTDIFYLIPVFGLGRVSIRLNRIFKIHRMIQFFHWTESQTNYPNLIRVGILIVYITLIIHWNACIYFLISERIGFGNDTWVYPSLTDEFGNATEYATLTRQYLFSFYWSTLTLTTIGELPGPRTDWEFAFVILDFMVGVLIFATIVGMVGGIIANMNIRRVEFQRRMDDIKHYMRYRSVGKPLQHRVIKWFDYLWNNNHSLDEEEILQSLPDKLKAEIAIHVHFETLRRVKIFDDCEAGLLEELVLKLQPQVYSPGDYVCRKGDIGKEMYIIKHGKLEVVTDDGLIILAVLTDGGYFGEISILNLSSFGNRRTANVRSVGYSELFCLSKTDLLEALMEYPDARTALEERGRQTLMNDSTLSKSELISMAVSKKGRVKAATMEALKLRMEDLESNFTELNERFVSLIGEYSTTQMKLRRKVRMLEAQVASMQQ